MSGDTSVPANDFVPLDDTVRAEFQRWDYLYQRLVPLWQSRSPLRAQVYAAHFGCNLEAWKKHLCKEQVGGYISGIAASVRGALLNGSIRDHLATGTFVLPEDGSMRVELILAPGSYKYEEQHREKDVYDPIMKRMVRQNGPGISVSELIMMTCQYCGDGFAHIGVSYVADSLRKHEITELPKLVLQPINSERILVSLDFDSKK